MKFGINVFDNVICVICLACRPEMRRVGAVYFCVDCCDRVFTTENPVKDEREKYLRYLKMQQEHYGY